MLTETKTENHDQGVKSQSSNNNEQNSFVDLLKAYSPVPIRKGQYLQGEILQIKDNVILADVDAKRTAIVPPQDLAQIDEDQLAELSIGDQVMLYVMRTPTGNDDLLVSLNKGLEQQDWVTASKYMENDELLELEVIGHNKGGLIVAFGRLHGFVPASHVPQLRHLHSQDKLASQKAKLVGETLPLKVIDVNPQRRRLVLSVKKAQKELRQQRLLELKMMEGETTTGRISSLVKFGAFVDLYGIEGLIHISEIAWYKVQNAGEIFTPGEEVELVILSVDIERERISLSQKALLPSPWELFARNHHNGELVEGVVTKVVDFGAFVVVDDSIEGLLHTSEMRGTKDFAPEDVLVPGDIILVRILSIQPEVGRLALSQRQVGRDEEMEWTFRRQQSHRTTLVGEEE